MPLSEEELRLLEQMERALVEDDPKLASTLRGTTLRRAVRRRAIIAGIAFAVGIAVLMAGAVSGLWWLGLIGFVVMLGAATVGLSAMKGQQQVGAEVEEPQDVTRHPSGLGVVNGGRKPRVRKPKQRASGSFMERMEERWRRRREQGY